MRYTTLMGAILLALFLNGVAWADEFDAAENFLCGDRASDIWSYSAYRVSDGENREFAYGRVPLSEVSKYGADAFYLPDGGQEFRPFFVRLGERLYCSPSFEGPAYEASIAWTSPSEGTVRISGFADLVGKIGARIDTGGVNVRLLAGGKEIWSAEATPDAVAEFSEPVDLARGDVVELRVGNASGEGPKVTEVNLHIAVP